MKRFLLCILLVIGTLKCFGQDKVTDELKSLSDNKENDKIIKEYASKSQDYSAKALYYIGLAYFRNEDDKNSIKFMDLSINKDSKDPKPYYIKASSLNYLKKYDEAIKIFTAAIALNPNNCEYYSGLGDAYYNLKKDDLALESYLKGTEKDGDCDRPYSMVAQIYSNQNKNEEALKAFYVAKSKISKTSDSYNNALFNIGLLEYLKGNYDNAEISYLESIEKWPDDYRTYPKLIQVYYAKKQYDKAKPLKEKLYEAHKKGLLEGNLKDMFCFDQFKHKDKYILAYERYEEGSNDIYNKHLFYVRNEKDELEYRIQTEYSPIAVELGGPKYLLCMTKGQMHATYNFGFNDDFKYEDLKESVIEIIDGKIQPGATSMPGK